MLHTRRTLLFAALLVLSGLQRVYANASDFEFRLVDYHAKRGSGAVVIVSLVHKPTGQLVPDALVFLSRIDMGPHGMRETNHVDLLPDTLPGYYRFETELTMSGDYALLLTAKVPGEAAPVQGRLRLHAMP
jgi:hypothetical protein